MNDRRSILQQATKRTRRAARRRGQALTWKAARELALGWCVAMWPNWFDGGAL